MNKNSVIAIVLVIILGLGLWWFVRHTKTSDTVTPTATVSPTGSSKATGSAVPTAQPNITITSPKANAVVDSPITVTGKARVFENQFTVQMKDSSGKVVYERNGVMSDAKESGTFGNYSVKIPVPIGSGTNYTISVFSLSAKGDGSYEGFASVPVVLRTSGTSTVSVAYTTSNDCSTVKLFPRTVLKPSEPAYISLVELLKGPSLAETVLGAGNQIPSGVQINSLRLTGNTMYADFDQTLQQGVAGSCRVQAIRSQITGTLKQFSNVHDVVISINGKTADILQP